MLLTVATLTCAVALAACGGSSKPKPASSQSAKGRIPIAFSECMRAHGVTNFPDPNSSGGISIPGNTINPRSPTFRAAQTSCFKLMPGGGPLNHKPTAQEVRRATQVSQCMRAHGVNGFPDPIVSNKPISDLDPSKYGLVADRGGIIIALPISINPQSPAFQAAAKTCNFPGP